MFSFKKTSFMERVQIACCHMGDNLISENNLEKILKLASCMHSSVRPYYFIFEGCISTDEKGMDLFLYIDTTDITTFEKKFCFKDLICCAGSESLVDFFNELKKDSFMKESNFRGVWLGFDLRSPGLWPTKPNLYLSINRWAEDNAEAVDSIFHTLDPGKMHTKKGALLSGFCSNEIDIFNIGFMLARSLDFLRICSRSRSLLSADSYITYLDRIGLHGPNESFASLLDRLRPYLSCISFDLDVGNQTHEKFGVSCYISRKKQLAERTKLWECVLEILAAEGLMCLKKQNQLLQWCGNHLEFGEFASYGVCQFFNNPQEYCTRGISHIKIVFSAQKATQAKAYLDVVVKRVGL